MSTLPWMDELTEPTNLQPIAHQPWTVTVDGEPLTVVTNGQGLVAVPGAHGYEAGDSDNIARVLAAKALPKAKPAPFDLAALRALLKLDQPEANPCAECKGAGALECEKCDGEGGHECECHCGDQHEVDCSECKGKGEFPCPTCKGETRRVDPVRIGCGWFDQRVLRKWLRPLTGDRATWAQDGPTRVALIVGDGMRVLVMPVRPEPTDGGKWEGPEFPLTSRAAATADPTHEEA